MSGITSIQSDVLDHSRPLSDLSVARRLSWASKRQTTRVEDIAYSLFGILDVNMPLLYGEGSKAFIRLQEAIIHQSTDQSIFAWDSPSGFIEPRELLLAPSPRCFMNGSKIRRRRGTASESAFTMSNKGLEITLPILQRRLLEDPTCPYVYLGILDCKYEGSSDVLALVMSQHPFHIQGETDNLELYVSGFERTIGKNSVSKYARLLSVSPADLVDVSPTTLTITKDLQSLSYIQAFNMNETSWFPVRFKGKEKTMNPTIHDVFPEQSWDLSTKTMRLRAPHSPCGGIVVDTKQKAWVLIPFGVPGASFRPDPTSRRIYKPVFIDPECPIEPHVKALMREDRNGGNETASLRLNSQQCIVARLWRGALTVSLENVSEHDDFAPSSPTTFSPPSSPIVSLRQASFSSPRRRDSMLQDGHSERSDSFGIESRMSWDSAVSQRRSTFTLPGTQPEVHRIRQCEWCRETKAKKKAERDRRRAEETRQAEQEKAERAKEEKQRKMKTRAKQAGVGVSIGSMLWELADGMEYL